LRSPLNHKRRIQFNYLNVTTEIATLKYNLYYFNSTGRKDKKNGNPNKSTTENT